MKRRLKPVQIENLKEFIFEQERLDRIIDVVEQQANNEGLWFIAQTAPEAYLQQELRRLHAVIEETYQRQDLELGAEN